MNEKLWGLLVAICLGLASFALKFTFDMNAKIQKIEATNDLKFEQVQKTLDQLANDKDTDIRQDQNITKLWKLSGWSRDQIHVLQFESGKSPTNWPDLNQ